ncbi:sporulation protein [Nonomuraea sp. NPDC048916]|uniref:sporulation protein n=1 Tax=Nonomuraea sp. NPDC048916 TaxID=3154232 RepID=UPI0033FA9676
MVFKRMLGAFGVGAPTVDTVLDTPRVQPGGVLSGEVRLRGGDFDADIEGITLGLVAGVEIEGEGGELSGLADFHRVEVSGPFKLASKAGRVIPFRIPVPWETPISEIDGQPLTGMAVGVRTELAIAKAVDKGDLDPVAVEPLPSQARILQAFPRLGFQFKSADVEAGQVYGVRQELPFYQEIEFYPPPQYAGRIGQVELTFVAAPDGLEVVLEADGSGSGDAIGRFRVGHDEALAKDWAAELDRWLGALAHHGGPGPYDGHDPAGHYGGHHGGHPSGHHGGHHGDGPGWGTVAAAGAAGLVGGYVVGEMVEEIFEDDDEGDDD